MNSNNCSEDTHSFIHQTNQASPHSSHIDQQDININTHAEALQFISKIHHLKYGYYSNPQWYIFLPTYIFAIFVVILLWAKVFISGINMCIGRVLCIYLLYRFLSLGFSNPGLAKEQSNNQPNMEIETDELKPIRYCNVCEIQRQRYVRHCNICNVCVKQYDHHCVFIGKCIGKTNIGEFKDFICMILTILIYGLIVAISMTQPVSPEITVPQFKHQ